MDKVTKYEGLTPRKYGVFLAGNPEELGTHIVKVSVKSCRSWYPHRYEKAIN